MSWPRLSSRFVVLTVLLACAGCGDSGKTSSGTAPTMSSSGGIGGGSISSSATSSSAGTGGAASSSGTGGSATSSSGGTGGTASSSSGTGGVASSSGGSGGAASSSSSSGTAACQDDLQCDDGLYCNGTETCAGGTCVPGTLPSCDDGIGCTIDTCDEAAKSCKHAPDASLCGDGVFCNGAEVCDVALGCQPGTPPSCDDGVGCTVDTCDESAKSCKHTPDASLCGDNVFCNGVEVCDVVLGCQPGTPPPCDDGISCTSDFCDQTSDSCKHVPNDVACSDGQFCNGAEVCDPPNGAPLTGCKAGKPPSCDDGIACTQDGCSNSLGQCTHTPVDALCDDNVFCNGQETCNVQIGCQSGLPVDCDDGRLCTTDACNEGLKTCTHTPVNAACDDGLYCNGVETCSPTGPTPTGCVAGTSPPCPSDGIACTVDACDEATKSCLHTASNALCPPGQFCIVQQNGCKAGTPCTTGAQCQDGNLCNGVEQCVNGLCAPGTPVDCDDSIACTVDTCNPGTGTCSHAVNHAYCNDGLACNGVETCDAAVGCVAGTPVNCNDGINCTQDDCVEPGGTCTHTPLDVICSDGKLCNGLEVCDPTSGCKAGAPYVCPSNGVACDTMVCDPVLNACKPIPHDDMCPCGQTCDPAVGCGNFCQVKTCQGKVYQCGDCLDNDGDCLIDSADPSCLGPCDNTEDSFYGGIPGQNNSPCKSDCYFDADTGSGNDDCYWSHKCDSHEVGPNYAPEDNSCAYNMNASIPGSQLSCTQLYSTQSTQCSAYCGPLTPNGCDCFGCCAIPGAPTTVWLGSENPSGTGSCNLGTVADPTMCKPCTQVAACLNPCDHCELCVGKTELPPDCIGQTCPGGAQPCGLPGQSPCATGSSCITGCCQANPQ